MAIARPNAERRSEIVAAARALLAEDGPAAFSMRRVAGRVGIRLASLQYHFRDRACLLAAVLDDAIARYEATLAPYREAAHADGTRAFVDALRWLLEETKEWEELTRFEIQLRALAFIDADAAAALDVQLALYRAFLTELVRGVNPALGAAESRRRGAVLASLLEGSILTLGPGRTRPRGLRRHACDVVDAALLLARAAPGS